MGVIKRQTLYGSLYSYLGVLTGYITTGILFPNYFSSEQVGLVNMLITYSTIFAQFASLGFNNATFRLFTYFRNFENKHNGFLFLALTSAITGFVISLAIMFILKPLLVSGDNGTQTILADYFIYIIPIVFFVLFFNLFDTYYTVLYNSIIGTFLKELLLRVLILIALLGFIYHFYGFGGFVNGFTISYFLPFLIIFFYLLKSGQISFRPQFGFLNKEMIKTLSAVSIFGILSYTTDVLVFNIDRIMIERMMGLSDTGIYSTAFLFGFIVMIPSRSLFKISTTVIADAWKNSDYKNLSDIYKKSCINQFLIGVLIFLMIMINLDNIMLMLPEAYADGKFVIVLVSLAMLANMAVGVNNVVIMTSKDYRINTYLLILLAVMMVVLNYIFIPIYGILGSALATLISKVILNLIRAVFVKWRYNLQPYNFKFTLIILLASVLFFLHMIIPVQAHYILDIIVRSSIIGVVFAAAAYYLKISEEYNIIVRSLVNTLKGTFRN